MTKDLSQIEPTKIGLPRYLDLTWPLILAFLALAIAPFDDRIVIALNPLDPIPWLDSIAHFLDRWSTRLELFILLSFFFLAILWQRLHAERIALFAFVTSWFMCEFVVGVLKRVTARPRPAHPDGIGDQLRVMFEHVDLKSFPSGHTATAVLVAIFVTLWRPKTWLVPFIWLCAVLIGCGRIYIGAHHPSDVLAGAAFGWLMMSVGWKITTLGTGLFAGIYPPKRLGSYVFLIWLIVLGWLFQDAPVLRDAVTGADLSDWRLPHFSLKEVVLEPLLGPACKLASLPNMKEIALWAAIWFGAIAAVSVLKQGRKSIKWIVVFAVLGVIWGFLSIAGLAGSAKKPSEKNKPQTWAFDLQSHLDDPYDGAISLTKGLERFRKLGYEMVVPTWHNQWVQGQKWTQEGGWQPIELFGAEWSGGSPATHPLHLLVFNQRQEPSSLEQIQDPKELIARVHEAGGLVIGSHFWRGDASQMPSLDELISAGIDGFEVAGRNEEGDPEILKRLELIRKRVVNDNLIGFGNSDFHGKRSSNHTWNLVRRDQVNADAEGLWRVMNAKGEEHQVVSVHSAPWHGPMAPIHAAVRYGREMPLISRISWMFWIVVLAALVWRRKETAVSSD